jgi:hypothetical protein
MWKGGVAGAVFDRQPGCLQTNLIGLKTNSRRQILHPKTQIQSDRTLNLNWTLEQGMIHGQGCKDCPSVVTHYFNAVMSPVGH